MTLTPQQTATVTLTQALSKGCDTVQLKYNGQWVRVEVSRGNVRIYTAKKDLIDYLPDPFYNAPETVCGTFIGNLLLDQSKIVLWDCWAICGDTPDDVMTRRTSVEGFSYRNRFALLHGQVQVWGSPLYGISPNFPIRRAKELWTVDEPHVCGLVFRDSNAPVGVTVGLARRYREVPGELV